MTVISLLVLARQHGVNLSALGIGVDFLQVVSMCVRWGVPSVAWYWGRGSTLTLRHLVCSSGCILPAIVEDMLGSLGNLVCLGDMMGMEA